MYDPATALKGTSAVAEALPDNPAVQALASLATDAKFDRGELTITQDRDEVRLALTDDGQGFDPAALGERQRRGHMGLLLVEQRVQDAGGTLQVTSTVGRGTKVVMRLPLAGPGVSGPLAR